MEAQLASHGIEARSHFPALSRREDGRPVVFADAAAGTQVTGPVITAMSSVAERGVSNLGGPYPPSRDAGAIMKAARRATADLYRCRPNEIVFGPNMTTLTFAVSRAIARHFGSGAEFIVTRLDHDANITPWVLAAREVGAGVEVMPARGGALQAEDLSSLISERTRLVAFTAASNATGTLIDVPALAAIAREAGVMTYVDAVHYAPHGRIDATAWDVDFVVSSSYKWFGPHAAALAGRGDVLDTVGPFKLRASPAERPWSWETGTQNFAVLAGMAAAVDYLADLGSGASRTEQLTSAFELIRAHEAELSDRFLAGVAEIPGTTVHGRLVSDGRTPTFAIEVEGRPSQEMAAQLATHGVYVSHGNYYALDVIAELGFERDGLARFGFAHYHTADDVDRALTALDAVATA